jgi:hypothetical protein
MSVFKTNKAKQGPVEEKLPGNYYEFFEKKAARMKELLERYPVPEHIFKKK